LKRLSYFVHYPLYLEVGSAVAVDLPLLIGLWGFWAGGIIKKVTQPPNPSKRTRTELDSDDEGDSDDLYDDLEDDEDMDENSRMINNGSGKKSSSDREYRPPRKVGLGGDPNADDSFDDSASGSNLNTSGGNKRQRKEKKIFDL
jgi:hypothetical protein